MRPKPDVVDPRLLLLVNGPPLAEDEGEGDGEVGAPPPPLVGGFGEPGMVGNEPR